MPKWLLFWKRRPRQWPHGLLMDIYSQGEQIMAALDSVITKLDALKTAVDTAVGVLAALKASQADPAQVAAVESAIDSATATLTAAVQ